MNRSFQIFLLLIAFGMLSITLGCEKDDICANQSITPFLIIRFMDIENTNDVDNVADLQVRYIPTGEGADTTAFNVYESAADRDSITLSLPVDKQSVTYAFYQNFDEDLVDTGEVDEEGNPIFTIELSPETEIDTVRFNYQVRNEYVSRACGFRSTYFNLQVEQLNAGGPNTFIDNFLTESTDIEDEVEAHLRFRH